MKSVTAASALLLVLAHAPALAVDHGPRVLGCDHRFDGKEQTGACLILGSGMNQGISWVVFEVEGRRFRFEDSSPDVIELIDKAGNTLKRLKGKNSSGSCRPGGLDADIYAFASGDRVCLYWR